MSISRRAISIAAMSILPICIIASKTPLAAVALLCLTMALLKS